MKQGGGIKCAAMSASRPAATWRRHLRHPALSARQRGWLSDDGSLTARLRERSSSFAVQVLRQRILRPGADESAALQIAPREWAWGREVLLIADGVPRVFAHSLLARKHARGPWQLFARMGERPLGAALFADPRIARQPLRFRRLDARHPLYRAAIRAAGIEAGSAPYLWARRSVFTRGGKLLMVCEVFLPEAFAT
ncbi:putative chorismate--pyruvate lyase [Sterolibacterium denitrificans]|uniref:Probable chorismate pyruvate-lyase n=2 Tax=Sterolibacterium denitrificans TaxID=157592 RepID=A0A7Z7MU39_9PROT|nr:putative chorismate--pyruvate lyase [Sterolibacterium denitrificans]